MTSSLDVAQTACLDAQLPLPRGSASSPPEPKTRTELTNASHRHGFRLLFEHCDEHPTPIGFGVDYEAMDPHWPVPSRVFVTCTDPVGIAHTVTTTGAPPKFRGSICVVITKSNDYAAHLELQSRK